jgi:hypothetical protein
MSQFSLREIVPTAMPILSRGNHSNPSQGACFMEYTSLLAGERFTDRPRCVDEELAAVLRAANDRLSDGDRPLLLPLLGRAIGLAVEPPPAGSAWCRPASARRGRRNERAHRREQTARLRRAVSRRFTAALGMTASPTTEVWSAWGEELHWLFWDLMNKPTTLTTSEDCARRLVERLQLLHQCYEEALDDLGLARTVSAGPPAGPVLPVATERSPDVARALDGGDRVVMPRGPG